MKSKRKSTFDPQVYLESVGASRKVAEFRKRQALFSQGEAADTVMYIQKGSVKLTVVNENGKEAVVAIFGSGDFFGEGDWQARPFAWRRRRRSCLRRFLSSARTK
jgi:CRP/FNR family transcriptional regulator, cyclic AMP receptor protein